MSCSRAACSRRSRNAKTELVNQEQEDDQTAKQQRAIRPDFALRIRKTHCLPTEYGTPHQEPEPWLHKDFLKIVVLLRTQIRQLIEGCVRGSSLEDHVSSLRALEFPGFLIADSRIAMVSIRPTLVQGSKLHFVASLSVSPFVDVKSEVFPDVQPSIAAAGVDFLALMCATGRKLLRSLNTLWIVGQQSRDTSLRLDDSSIIELPTGRDSKGRWFRCGGSRTWCLIRRML